MLSDAHHLNPTLVKFNRLYKKDGSQPVRLKCRWIVQTACQFYILYPLKPRMMFAMALNVLPRHDGLGCGAEKSNQGWP
jgi:hypothetical protein